MTYDDLKDQRAEWPTDEFRLDEETLEERDRRQQAELEMFWKEARP